MEKVPPTLIDDPLTIYLEQNQLNLVSRGKVRDTWKLNKNELLVVATDRISIFDFVLNTLVPHKGEVLTALTHFWANGVLSEFHHHLISSKEVPGYNAAYDWLNTYPDIPIGRCLVVKNMKGKIYPFEMIYWAHIGGSVFAKYQQTGKAGGHDLAPGLPKWSKLDRPIFTPSTKEEVGHDINVDAFFFFKEMSAAGLGNESRAVDEMLTRAYSLAYSYAESRGILILDTKFEVAGMTIADEILTPDSSRFALKTDWEAAMKENRDPYFHDKQPVRDWGATVQTPFYTLEGKSIIGINKLNPANPDHLDFVRNLEVPNSIIADTTNRYLGIFESLTGYSLTKYQKEKMGVPGIR